MTRPAHIALVVNDLNGYGAQRVAVDVSGALARAGRRVTLVTLEEPRTRELTPPAGVHRVALQRSGRGPLSYVLTSRQLRGAMRQIRPDAVIANMTFSNLVCLLGVPRGTPVVAVEHNVLSRNLTIERSPRSIALLVRVLYPRARAVVGVSDDVVEDLVTKHGVARRRARRIYNPLPRSSDDLAGAGTAIEDAVPHPWLEQGGPGLRMVLVGGLRRAKGHRVALEALAQLRKVSEGWKLICIGDGPLRDELAQLTRELGVDEHVAFVGHVEDPRRWMASADVVLVPSLWEGFGLVAVEAATVGTTVVASDATGLRELVPRYVRGLRAPVGSAGALASALERLAAGELPHEPTEGLEEFEPDHVAQRYLATLEE